MKRDYWIVLYQKREWIYLNFVKYTEEEFIKSYGSVYPERFALKSASSTQLNWIDKTCEYYVNKHYNEE